MENRPPPDSTTPACDSTRTELFRNSAITPDTYCSLCSDLGVRCKVGHHPRELAPPAQAQAPLVAPEVMYLYSCYIVRARTRKGFRANVYRIAELHCAVTRSDGEDGIFECGLDLKISLIFESRTLQYQFETQLRDFISAISGHKRPLVDADCPSHPNEIILNSVVSEKVEILSSVSLARIYRTQYQHDFSNNDAENSAECDGYSELESLSSAYTDVVNIDDPQMQAQMIEDPHFCFWEDNKPEIAHIKSKAKCTAREADDPNNIIPMSRLLHGYFDGLSAKRPQFPSMKIRYLKHDSDPVPCPIHKSQSAQYDLPLRYRVTVLVMFYSLSSYTICRLFLRQGGIETYDKDTGVMTYQLDLYFLNPAKCKEYLDWKEKETDKSWRKRRSGVSVDDILAQRYETPSVEQNESV